MGRASSYSDAIAEVICTRLIDGESLRSICRDEAMPSAATVCRWLADNEKFREQYVRAREAQADTLADEILEIADDSAHDTEVTDNGERPNTEWIARSRLRVDARKWLASKMAPKKYGDRINADVTSNGESLVFNIGTAFNPKEPE